MAVRRFLLLAGLAAVACAPAGAPSGGSSAPDSAVPQTLVLASTTIPATVDPHLNITGSARKYDLFETLTLPNIKGDVIQPALATEWRSVDATTWRLTLRKDAKWHDGTPVTASDVAFTWSRVANPALRSPIPGFMASVDSMTAVDAGTVDVKTKAADPLLPRRLFYLAIVPKAYLERVGDAGFVEKPIGSGPFTFKEFKPDDRLVLTGWSEHPTRKPKLTELTVRLIPDAASRVAGLRTGEIDYVQAPPLDGVKGLQDAGFETWTNLPGTFGVILDTYGNDGTDAGPIADTKVRQAINYAIDREAIAKGLWQGLPKPSGQLISEGTNGYSADIRPYTFDLNRAKQLLAESAYPNGFRVTINASQTLPEYRASLLAIQDQLKALNITVEAGAIDSASFTDLFYKRKPTNALVATGLVATPMFDADVQLSYFSSVGPIGKRYTNQAFDTAYLASRSELDPAKRAALLKEAAQILQNDPPWLGIVTVPVVSAWAKTVKIDGGVPGEGTLYFETVSRTR